MPTGYGAKLYANGQEIPLRQTVSRGRLLFTIGLPRSGKSVWCDDWVRGDRVPKVYEGQFFEFRHQDRPRVIVCGDDFRRALYGREFQVEAEGSVFAAMDVATRALLNRGFDVIIDETSTTEQTLLRYLRLDINATPVWFDTPVSVCVSRAHETGRPYLEGPIYRMAAQLELLKRDWDSIIKRLKDYLASRATQDIAV